MTKLKVRGLKWKNVKIRGSVFHFCLYIYIYISKTSLYTSVLCVVRGFFFLFFFNHNWYKTLCSYLFLFFSFLFILICFWARAGELSLSLKVRDWSSHKTFFFNSWTGTFCFYFQELIQWRGTTTSFPLLFFFFFFSLFSFIIPNYIKKNTHTHQNDVILVCLTASTNRSLT